MKQKVIVSIDPRLMNGECAQPWVTDEEACTLSAMCYAYNTT
jgi:hypothetical protein